jgi:hypothetical protein
MSRTTEKMTYVDGQYFCNLCDSPHEGEELAEACYDDCLGPDVLFGEQHGPDGYGGDDAVHALPEWCSTGDCGDSRCHRDRPRAGCTEHRKCRDRYEA